MSRRLARPGVPEEGNGGDELVVGAEHALPGEAAVLRAAQRSLRGEHRGLRRVLPFLGPAFVASIAYVDPGNFATNMAAGARFGYMLLWVVLVANVMAMLVQTMSAKLGVATGMDLAQLCRHRFRRPVTLVLWVQAELVAMATDLAEFVGAAIGINLLTGLPLLPAAVLTGVAAFAILAMQARGFRRLEAVIAVLLGVIVVAFAAQAVLARPSPAEFFHGLLVPRFSGSESVLLAVGIVGATVMPHVIYLHSSLTKSRIVGATPAIRRRIARFERIDVIVAMSAAGVINMTMLAIAAATFHTRGLTDVGADLSNAYDGLGRLLGAGAGIWFGIGLLASGLASSSVGTLTGQVVMSGFLERRIPVFLRRAVTMVPGLLVIAAGVDPSRALVLSQVALSFGIPFALVPLLMFCSSRSLMGNLVNTRSTTIAAVAVTVAIVGLNVFLVERTLR
jgi:manganese transport protein